MNIERFSEAIRTIKEAAGKLEFMLTTEQKRNPPPAAPQKTEEPLKTEGPLKTEEEVLAAIQERVAQQCSPGLWEQVQVSMKTEHQRDERRVWRQIVAAI